MLFSGGKTEDNKEDRQVQIMVSFKRADWVAPKLKTTRTRQADSALESEQRLPHRQQPEPIPGVEVFSSYISFPCVIEGYKEDFCLRSAYVLVAGREKSGVYGRL